MKSSTEQLLKTLPWVLFAASMLIYLVHGPNAYWMIHDGLDSEVSFRILPLRAGQMFSADNAAIVPQVMNGIPRNCFNASSFNAVSLLFAALSPAWAYLLNFLIVKSIAFVGMFLLLRDRVLKETNNQFLIGLLALSFSLLPFYTIYGITIPGAPLLIWALFGFADTKRKALLIIALIYPFYSSFVLGGFAIIGFTFLTAIYFLWQKNRANAMFFGLTGMLLTALFFISEINLFSQFLFDHSFVSHRTEWVLDSYSWKVLVYAAFNMFFNGQYHSPSFHLILLLGIGISILLSIKSIWKNKLVVILLGFLMFFALFYGAYKWSPIVDIRNKVSILKAFQFDRLYFLNPVFWTILFAVFYKQTTSAILKTSFIILAIANVGFVVYNNSELLSNASCSSVKNECLQWNTYFAPQTFEKVASAIGQPQDQYRVVSIGVDPAVTQLNGFYTLDSYQNNYPLQYKHEFRKIIAPELQYNDTKKADFDNWGSKCLIITRKADPSSHILENLELDFNQLYTMGGRYIISIVEINTENKPLYLQQVFVNGYQGSDVFLYSVAPAVAI